MERYKRTGAVSIDFEGLRTRRDVMSRIGFVQVSRTRLCPWFEDGKMRLEVVWCSATLQDCGVDDSVPGVQSHIFLFCRNLITAI